MLAPLLIVIHVVLLAAVQAQPVAAVTVTVPVDDPGTTLADAGAIVGAHAAPACVTVNVVPAEPTRREEPWLAFNQAGFVLASS